MLKEQGKGRANRYSGHESGAVRGWKDVENPLKYTLLKIATNISNIRHPVLKHKKNQRLNSEGTQRICCLSQMCSLT